MFNILQTWLSLLGPEEIKRAAWTNRLMGQTRRIGEVEVAEVPILESFLCLCHNAMSFVITAQNYEFIFNYRAQAHIFLTQIGR